MYWNHGFFHFLQFWSPPHGICWWTCRLFIPLDMTRLNLGNMGHFLATYGAPKSLINEKMRFLHVGIHGNISVTWKNDFLPHINIYFAYSKKWVTNNGAPYLEKSRKCKKIDHFYRTGRKKWTASPIELGIFVGLNFVHRYLFGTCNATKRWISSRSRVMAPQSYMIWNVLKLQSNSQLQHFFLRNGTLSRKLVNIFEEIRPFSTFRVKFGYFWSLLRNIWRAKVAKNSLKYTLKNGIFHIFNSIFRHEGVPKSGQTRRMFFIGQTSIFQKIESDFPHLLPFSRYLRSKFTYFSKILEKSSFCYKIATVKAIVIRFFANERY